MLKTADFTIAGPAPTTSSPSAADYGRAPPEAGVDHRIATVGTAARRVFNVDGPARVLAAFRRSFYVETANGALVCVGSPELGAGPLSALCATPSAGGWRSAGVVVGGGAWVSGGLLRLKGGSRFSAHGATVWRAPPRPTVLCAETLRDGLEALVVLTCGRLPREGLGRLVGARFRATDAALVPPALAGPVGPALSALARWWRGRDGVRGVDADPAPAVAALIGLGPGLTPAGDDFLGGFLIALRFLGGAAATARLAAWVRRRASGRTGRISLALLECACAGEGAAALHEVLGALVATDQPGLEPAVARLGAVGHSSGWDALAGAAFACTLVSRSGQPPAWPRSGMQQRSRCATMRGRGADG